MDTEKSLVCRELVCLSLPSLSPLPTLRVAQYFSFMHSLPVSVLIKLTLYSSEVEDIASVSVAQNHPKRTNIRSHYLLPQTCVWISCNSLDNLPNPRFRHVMVTCRSEEGQSWCLGAAIESPRFEPKPDTVFPVVKNATFEHTKRKWVNKIYSSP